MAVVAYIVVVLLVQFCYTIGTLVGGFTAALLLGWSSVSVRTKIAGQIGGLSGVALAVAFGWGVFRVLQGEGSYTLGPFVASTLPLLGPLWNDFRHWQRVDEARQEMIDEVRATRSEDEVRALEEASRTGHGSSVEGGVLGPVLAAVWFFNNSLAGVLSLVHVSAPTSADGLLPYRIVGLAPGMIDVDPGRTHR